MAEGLNGTNEEKCSPSQMNGDQHEHLRITSGNKEGSTESNSEDKICRDYLRKICRRGQRCKFLHPENTESTVNAAADKKDIIFCHDFRHGNCHRNVCRFIHSTTEEEDRYINSGFLYPHLLEQAIYKGQVPDTSPDGETPVCKDYIMGECLRKRPKCRFRHLSQSEYKRELYGDRVVGVGVGDESPDPKRQRYNSLTSQYDRDDFHCLERKVAECPRDLPPPRRDVVDRERELAGRERDRMGIEEILHLREQLESIRKENSVLKKENSVLRATNDFLLEKITTIGMSKAAGTVATVTVPTVSLASTIPVAQVSSIPLSISSDGCSVGSVVAMTAGPPQPQASAQSLAPQTQINVAAAPTAVLGPVGSVQASLSQAMASNPVTLPAVNLSSIAPQTSMAPSLTPSIASPMPCSAANIPQAMSMSGASGHSGHLVTYPIMTQPALRQQIQ